MAMGDDNDQYILVHYRLVKFTFKKRKIPFFFKGNDQIDQRNLNLVFSD